jgi:probable phosphoglycerate mutase
METASILGAALGLAPQPLDGLAELDFGWLEGAPSFLWRDGGMAAAALRPLRALLHWLTAERPEEFRDRVAQALEEMVRRHPNGRLLVVAHFAVFSSLLSEMMGTPGSDWLRFGPWTACAISEVRRLPGPHDGKGPGWEILRLNDTSHLEEGEAA